MQITGETYRNSLGAFAAKPVSMSFASGLNQTTDPKISISRSSPDHSPMHGSPLTGFSSFNDRDPLVSKTYSADGRPSTSWLPSFESQPALNTTTCALYLGEDSKVHIIVKDNEGHVIDTIPEEKTVTTSYTLSNSAEKTITYGAGSNQGENVNLLV